MSHFVANWCRLPGSNLENLKSELGLFKSRLEKIKVCIKATNPLSPCSRVLHLQRYCLARHTQQIRLTVESVRGRNDDRSYERSWTGTVSALPYPAEKNTLDLIIIPIPSQFVDNHSPDRPSDHNRVSGTLKVVILPIKKPKRKVYRYQKGDYESMRTDALKFAKENYFNEYSDTRSAQEFFLNLITFFIQDSADKCFTFCYLDPIDNT